MIVGECGNDVNGVQVDDLLGFRGGGSCLGVHLHRVKDDLG